MTDFLVDYIITPMMSVLIVVTTVVVLVLGGNAVYRWFTHKPCWTAEVCGPEYSYTYYIRSGNMLIPATGTTRDCGCPPAPGEVRIREWVGP